MGCNFLKKICVVDPMTTELYSNIHFNDACDAQSSVPSENVSRIVIIANTCKMLNGLINPNRDIVSIKIQYIILNV